MPYRNTLQPIITFDQTLQSALMARFEIPSPIPPTAIQALLQPGRNGGLGLRSMELVAPAAKWAAASVVANDIHPLINSQHLPCILDRAQVHTLLADHGVEVSNVPGGTRNDYELDEQERKTKFFQCKHYAIPTDPSSIHTFYQDKHNLPDLQRSLTKQQEDYVLEASKGELDEIDVVRHNSIKLKSTSHFINHNSRINLNNTHISMGIRMRLGLHPIHNFNPDTCPLCRKDMKANPNHALGCGKLRQTIIHTRHDKAVQLIAEFARSVGAVSTCTSRSDGARGEHVPDGYIYLRNTSIIYDVTGITTSYPRYVSREFRTQGGAFSDRETAKTTTYKQFANDNQLTFFPVVIDQYGKVGKKAMELFEKIATQSLDQDSYRAPHERMTLATFLIELSCIWQTFNAMIISHWACKSRALIYKRPEM